MEFIGIMLGGIFFSFCLACWIVLSVVRKFSRTLMIAGIVIILIPAAIGAVSTAWYMFVEEPRGTRMLEAVEAGDVAKVRKMLDEGAHEDSGFEGRTPLSAAASNGNTAIVRLLLDRGAGHPYALERALSEAAEGKHADVVALLLSRGADARQSGGILALNTAVRNGNAEMVRSLLAHGADPNAKDPYSGKSLLATAVKSGDKEIVKLLRNARAKD